MDALRRCLVLLFSVALVAAAGLAAMVTLGVLDIGARYTPGVLLEVSLAGQPLEIRALWLVGSALGALLAVVLARVALSGLRPGAYLVDEDASSGGGSVTIGARGLRAMVARSASVAGVEKVNVQVQRAPAGWRVRANLVVHEEGALPTTATEAAANVRDQLERATGVPVDKLDLNVDYARPARVARLR